MSDQIMSDCSSNKPFAITKSIYESFHVGFVVNGRANDLLPASEQYIINPLKNFFLNNTNYSNDVSYQKHGNLDYLGTIEKSDTICYPEEEL